MHKDALNACWRQYVDFFKLHDVCIQLLDFNTTWRGAWAKRAAASKRDVPMAVTSNTKTTSNIRKGKSPSGFLWLSDDNCNRWCLDVSTRSLKPGQGSRNVKYHLLSLDILRLDMNFQVSWLLAILLFALSHTATKSTCSCDTESCAGILHHFSNGKSVWRPNDSTFSLSTNVSHQCLAPSCKTIKHVHRNYTCLYNLYHIYIYIDISVSAKIYVYIYISIKIYIIKYTIYLYI